MLGEIEREWLADKAKKEKAKKAGETGGRSRPKSDSLPNTSTGKLSHNRANESREQAAASHNVSSRKVQQAQKVSAAAPQLAEKVKAGEMPLAQAVREVERPRLPSCEGLAGPQSLAGPEAAGRDGEGLRSGSGQGVSPAVGSPDTCFRDCIVQNQGVTSNSILPPPSRTIRTVCG
jgi:hypothetical protein